MRMRTDGRPGRGPAATRTPMETRRLRAAAFAGALALAGCGGGGGGGPTTPPDTDTGTDPMPRPPAEAAAALVSGLYFDYALEGAGAAALEEAGSVRLSCPAGGCAAHDLRALSGRDGTGTRDGFATVTGTSVSGPPLTEAFSGVSATVSGASFTRYGFWGRYGWAAVESGRGTLSAEAGGRTWSGTFRAAHGWAAGTDPSGTPPAGTGSAVWRGIAEAARTADFERLPGRAELRIADLSRPLVDVDIDLDIDDGGGGGGGVALRWTGIEPAGGGFGKGAAGADRIDGRFHGPDHDEAWGTFDTGAYVGAFGARRE